MRTPAGRRFRDLCRAFAAEIGGTLTEFEMSLIRQAAVRPTPRRPTKVPKAQRKERLESKKHRSGIKSLRRARPAWD